MLGGNGAGKSTFLSLARGDIWPTPSSAGQRLFFVDGAEQTSPIGFRERTGLVSPERHDTYLRRGWDTSALDVVCSGFWGSAFLHQTPSEAQLRAARAIMAALGIDHLGGKSILDLSQGEAMKVLIARGLVHRPSILFLDECCDGLDSASRRRVLVLLQRVAEQGTRILFATHRLSELVPAITHALVMEDGRIAKRGPKELVLKGTSGPTSAGRGDKGCFREESTRPESPSFLFLSRNADVYLDGKQVLEGITWLVRPHENWAVMGSNGAGKTTLLRLAWGDLSPALGGKVCRLGTDQALPVWEIKRRIAYVSPRLQAEHHYSQTGLETVLSGFSASIGLNANLTSEEEDIARFWIDFLGLQDYSCADIRPMSYGHLRRFLIARAMVTRPDLVLLDEPCDGLDVRARCEFLETLEKLSEGPTGIIYATHHLDELGPWITHIIRLEEGRVSFSGPMQGI